MHKLYQEVTHHTPTKPGDCLRATLAGLLHLPPAAVPLFAGRDWRKELNAWLRRFNLCALDVAMPASELQAAGVVGLHHELHGPTDGIKGAYHSCLALDGELVHDPLPHGAGLAPLPAGDRINGAQYESTLLVALRPWQWRSAAQAAQASSALRAEFERWAVTERHAEQAASGELWFVRRNGDVLWQAWAAGAAAQAAAAGAPSAAPAGAAPAP